jgi:hypothetical protein
MLSLPFLLSVFLCVLCGKCLDVLPDCHHVPRNNVGDALTWMDDWVAGTGELCPVRSTVMLDFQLWGIARVAFPLGLQTM